MSEREHDDFPLGVLGTLIVCILAIALAAIAVWSMLGDLAVVVGLALLAVGLMATLLGRSARVPEIS